MVLPWDMKVGQLNDKLVHTERKAERDKKRNTAQGAVTVVLCALIFVDIRSSRMSGVFKVRGF